MINSLHENLLPPKPIEISAPNQKGWKGLFRITFHHRNSRTSSLNYPQHLFLAEALIRMMKMVSQHIAIRPQLVCLSLFSQSNFYAYWFSWSVLLILIIVRLFFTESRWDQEWQCSSAHRFSCKYFDIVLFCTKDVNSVQKNFLFLFLHSI